MVVSTGCRSTGPALQTSPPSDLAAQVTTLSNDVVRLQNRLESVLQEWEEFRTSIQPIQKYLDRMNSQPVVEEVLIGVPEPDGK